MTGGKQDIVDEIAQFYTIQRLEDQYPRSSKTGFDSVFSLAYMGSSEFEWGAIPKALRRLRTGSKVVVTEVTVNYDGSDRTVFLVSGHDDAAAAAEEMQRWTSAKRPFNSMELTYFERALAGEDTRRTVAWWSLEADVIWTLDRDVANRALSAVGNS